MVAPGFIDMHNHSDFTLVEDGNAQSMIRQGVTTMILGEGGSAAPSSRWKDFAAYFAELMRGGISTNVATYVGSSRILDRRARRTRRPANPGGELRTACKPR